MSGNYINFYPLSVKWLKILFLYSIFIPLIAPAQINPSQVKVVLERYFERSRQAPPLSSIEIENTPLWGRTLVIVIRSSRARLNDDLGYAFGAAATVASRCTVPFETLKVIARVRYKRDEETVAVGPADCAIEYIVKRSRSFSDWWRNCLQFL